MSPLPKKVTFVVPDIWKRQIVKGVLETDEMQSYLLGADGIAKRLTGARMDPKTIMAAAMRKLEGLSIRVPASSPLVAKRSGTPLAGKRAAGTPLAGPGASAKVRKLERELAAQPNPVLQTEIRRRLAFAKLEAKGGGK